MASRKGSISLVPRLGKGVGNKPTAPVSARYEKALQVLSEERMRQACRLVLQPPTTSTTTTTQDHQEEPDQQAANNPKKNPASSNEIQKEEKKQKPQNSVFQQLLKSYRECETAVKVIRKEAPSDMFLSTPPSLPLARTNTAGAARPHAKPILNAKHPPTGLKSSTTGAGTLLNRGNRMRRRPDAKIMRGSRTSLTIRPSHFGGGGGAANLARTSVASTTSAAAAAFTTTSRNDLDPPPEARQFLAMLNQDTQTSSLPQISTNQRKETVDDDEEREFEFENGEEDEEEDTSPRNNDAGKETEKDNPRTGRPKRPRSGSKSSPERRVNPRRSA